MTHNLPLPEFQYICAVLRKIKKIENICLSSKLVLFNYSTFLPNSLTHDIDVTDASLLQDQEACRHEIIS